MTTLNGVLVIVAHPDDMEFMAGGTVCRMAQEGAKISELVITKGDRGSFELEGEDLARRRRREAMSSAKVLGLESVFFLDYPDGMLADIRFNEIRERVMARIRHDRPNAIMTWDPFAPYETHPDHRITGMAATEAAGFSHLPLFHPDQLGRAARPPAVAKTYYFAKHPVNADHVVDISDQIERKIEALCCHRTQMEFLLAGMVDTAKARSGHAPHGIDPKDYRPVIEAIVRKRDALVGKRIGASYGEQFRLSEPQELKGFLELEHGNGKP